MKEVITKLICLSVLSEIRVLDIENQNLEKYITKFKVISKTMKIDDEELFLKSQNLEYNNFKDYLIYLIISCGYGSFNEDYNKINLSMSNYTACKLLDSSGKIDRLTAEKIFTYLSQESIKYDNNLQIEFQESFKSCA